MTDQEAYILWTKINETLYALTDKLDTIEPSEATEADITLMRNVVERLEQIKVAWDQATAIMASSSDGVMRCQKCGETITERDGYTLVPDDHNNPLLLCLDCAAGHADRPGDEERVRY